MDQIYTIYSNQHDHDGVSVYINPLRSSSYWEVATVSTVKHWEQHRLLNSIGHDPPETTCLDSKTPSDAMFLWMSSKTLHYF